MAEKQGEWNGEKVVLTSSLEVKYVDDEDNAPIRAIATVKKEDGTPLKDVPVLIFYEGGQVGQPVPSNDKGEVKLLTGFLHWGTYEFTFKVNEELRVVDQIKVFDRDHRQSPTKPKGGSQQDTQQGRQQQSGSQPQGGQPQQSGGQQSQSPRITTRDLMISGPAVQEDGSFLIGCSVILEAGSQGKGKGGQAQTNKSPASGARFQYFTGADPQGMRQMVEPNGRAAASFKVRRETHGDKISLYIKVWREDEDENEGRLLELREIPLPAAPPKKRLRVTSVSKGLVTAGIALELRDRDGKLAGGRVVANVFKREGDMVQELREWEIPASGNISIELPRFHEPQVITFYLQDDDKIRTDPPARIPGFREDRNSGTVGTGESTFQRGIRIGREKMRNSKKGEK